jgi:phage tail-like protein
MAGTVEDSTWPVPKFHFEVDFGPDLSRIAFQEVSGLDTAAHAIEDRHGNSPSFSTIKMPGIVKYSNVTMKRGVFVDGDRLQGWITVCTNPVIKRRTVVIKLIDDKEGAVIMQWTLRNAWPTKVTSADLKSDGNEVAVESIEIAHEGITVTDGA